MQVLRVSLPIRVQAALFLILVISGGAIAAAAPQANDSYVVSLRRLTEQEYRNSIADIFGKEVEVRGSFEPTKRSNGLEAISTAVLSVTPVGFESFNKMADDIAAQVTAEKYRAKLPCTPRDPKAHDDHCASKILSHYGLLLFRRRLTDAELDNRVGLSRRIADQTNDFYAGLRYSLSMLLQLPDFVFRTEFAIPSADGKRGLLDSYSRAIRLSFLMWNTTPDAELLRAAASGELNTSAGLAKQVDRLMASPRLDAGMRAFFDDMLQLNNFDTVSKDSLLYPKWGSGMADSAREETLRTVIDLALHENGDIRDLMTTRQTFIDRRLAVLYRVPFPFTADWVKYEFPADSGRSGILTQISMLAMFSHPGRSSPTKRGVALLDIFLCAPTPEPPNDVDFSVVNDPQSLLKTVRERLMAHATNKVCASCHTRSDPMGLSLEAFDTIGGYRTTENGETIDVSATIQGHSFSGAQGLGQYIHDSPQYPACVARRLYSYSRGLRSWSVEDFPDAYRAFQNSGFRLRALLRSMALNESFYAAPPPANRPTGTSKEVSFK
jgi:Protein of unknown function (DUF1592)/Protein of unknown function (DUF1588)/Protein of unknown function (DUF1587)/Protein of unknown function (DUF1595)